MPHASVQDLRSFIDILQKENELAVVTAEVDPHLEIAEIHRRTVAQNGPALLFTNVKDSQFPVATNLFGSQKRLELAFPDRPEKMVAECVKMLTHNFPPSLKIIWEKRSLLKRLCSLGIKRGSKAPVAECASFDLDDLPILKCWPDDGGSFITLPLVLTHHPETNISNLGMYRIQRFAKNRTGLHFQIGKGGGFHYLAAQEQGKNLPVSIFLGGPPALVLSAISPLPENVPELIFASLLMGNKLKMTHDNLIANAEFAIVGHAKPHEREMEGPFGDHYGYYGMAHEFPVFHLEKIWHRKGAIYPATVVGKPPQEDLFIGNYLQKLFSPLIRMTMPQVEALWSYGEAGFHPLAAAKVKERYEKEALGAAFRILGEGQLTLTKMLMVTDCPIDVSNIKELLETVLARFRPETDFLIFGHTSNDTLDYTGPQLNKGSKAILMGLGKEKRALPSEYKGSSTGIKAIPFCKGCLCIESKREIEALVNEPSFKEWPFVVLVDDVKQATSSNLEFLWTLFTRFEPAQDIYAKNRSIQRSQIAYELPLVIDARMKLHYPQEAIADPATTERVEKRWDEFQID
ncbi:MAG TPA: UbiD family decarboxylase [Chlamydiales bacterium]|nr:UbiD family decarboxylase [Chlamydiales bacterium]